MYKVNLECFQGPLDLLLHLIEKMEIDIHNIPIASLTDSYLEYLNNSDELSLENAEEYIVMASTLIHIKSKSLLPQDVEEVIEDEQELVQKLIDYRNYKQICDVFDDLQIERQNFGEKYPEDIEVDANLMLMSANLLKKALKRVLENNKANEIPTNIKYRKEISIENIRSFILKYVTKKDNIQFSDLISNYDTKEEIVATFICILEMIKENRIICKEIGEELYIEKTF
ncbi:segregation/condensation protein A [Gemella sp. GH3]|uniref:segregation and condensation protein A n=1 Tax=unclassified Gemella TaxID=2624949 RepID=UPI0015CF9149|nr:MULTISPECIES: segregation/condensation protein A [unclassified Gemella]MBF0714395.1 segregation/condensation protein A [Gemella sp. GH3.1]NYS51347.1 segregation/condensation protein A [Gemella sp. GH3]